MSLENHPNFHAVKFATDITISYFESLIIPIEKVRSIGDSINYEILMFVERIEDLVDKSQGD